MATINLSELPPPQIVEELDFETILDQRKARLLELYPEAAETLALESEPLNYLLQENAYRELVWRQRVNEAAKGVMLAFAQGADLDQMAANNNTQRLVIEPAEPTAVPPKAAVMEDDESLRLRAQAAYETMAVAGPRLQYETLARAADSNVLDASAISPAGAEVTITVLAREGDGTADQNLLDTVDAALQPDEVRPLADRVTVQSAAIETYEIEAILYIPAGPESPAIVERAQQQLADYTADRRLAKSIYRTAITSALHVTGITHVELISPAADILRDSTQAAYCTSINLIPQVDNE